MTAGVTAPAGFRAAGVAAGLKQSGAPDVAVVINDGPQHAAAGVFTRNRFAAAPVLAHHFGPRVGVSAYVLAASTGLARMEERRHFVADVLFGAGIGLAAGHEVLAGSRVGTLLGHLSITPWSAGFVAHY